MLTIKKIINKIKSKNTRTYTVFIAGICTARMGMNAPYALAITEESKEILIASLATHDEVCAYYESDSKENYEACNKLCDELFELKENKRKLQKRLNKIKFETSGLTTDDYIMNERPTNGEGFSHKYFEDEEMADFGCGNFTSVLGKFKLKYSSKNNKD
jgi:hypothetical protein